MEYLAIPAVKLTLICLLIILLFAGWQYFPKKKIFLAFCTVLIAASLFLFFSHKQASRPAISEEAKYAMQLEQHSFITWYNDYKKNIDSIHHHWQQYHTIMQAFKNDEISIQTVYTRLKRLQESSADLKNKIARLEPPPGLEDANYELTIRIIQKTRDYVNREYEVISKTKEAADPANLKTIDQPQQVRALNRMMILYSPVNLNIADEISQLKSNLTIPDEE